MSSRGEEKPQNKSISNGDATDGRGALVAYIRIGFIGLAVVVQVLFTLLVERFVRTYAAPIYLLVDILALIVVIYFVNRQTSSAMRIAWIVFILIAPFLGVCLYYAWGRVDFNRSERGKFKESMDEGFSHIPIDEEYSRKLAAKHPNDAKYIAALNRAHFPAFEHTKMRYFPIGEEYFESLIEDLQQAEHYIFIDYFIIGTGVLWNRIHEVLLTKISHGVEVRIMYDDMGSLFTVSGHFLRRLRNEGFKATVFSPAQRFISKMYLNYRNHQKIVVVDGSIGYTGGVNLADEYVNIESRLGKWKDVGIRLEGEAVRSLTVQFLQMWDVADRSNSDYERYLAPAGVEMGAEEQVVDLQLPAAETVDESLQASSRIGGADADDRVDANSGVDTDDGMDAREDVHVVAPESLPQEAGDAYCIPYADGPHNKSSNPALDLVSQAIGSANDYIWLTTPYLVLDHEMIAQLCLAARGGVDVRIATPGKNDHWYVRYVNNHNFRALIAAGVKIYAYTPGFIHAKVMLWDDRCATVGTVNVDLRSFYLNYENGVFVSGDLVVADIKEDLEEIWEESRLLTDEDMKALPWWHRMFGAFLNIFAPLM